MIKSCIICGKEFEPKNSSITCSDECSLKRRRQTQRNFALKTEKFTLKKKICKICGKEFETYRSKQVCCSQECSDKNYEQNLIEYGEKNRNLINEKRMKRYYESEREQFKECTCVTCGKQFITQHKRKYCEECAKNYNTNYMRKRRSKQPKEDLVVEDLYKDFLKDKVVNAEELVSMIKAIPVENYSKEDFAVHIIDLIYSHANPKK